MTRRQRRIHQLAWAALVPLLVCVVVAGLVRRERAGLALRRSAQPASAVELRP